MNGIGILGMGKYLPPTVRTNDAWSGEVTALWRRGSATADDVISSAVAMAVSSIGDSAEPFAGICERRVMSEAMTASDMELCAASQAIEDAEISAEDLRLIVCASFVPDQLLSNNACRLHHRLRAPSRCAAVSLEAGCDAFLPAVSMAVSAIGAHSGGYALVVQSSAVSRILDYERPSSQYFGDGATAAVIGPVSAGHGLLAPVVHRTDGSLNGAMAAGSRGRPWYRSLRMQLHSPDVGAAHRLVTRSLEFLVDVAQQALEDGSSTSDAVDFFNVHQGFPWMLDGMRSLLGLERARAVDTFTRYGNCAGATLPLGLCLGAADGVLRPDDLVLLAGLGVGATASAGLFRWGR